ncbi:hypothetical protein QEH59_02180 [Coraliomargarita sp. SDUM461004]|uniref:SH3b domain-containing protein n=1 Tax=Thalassobacterium sedimentorum TaxID=3041258 RepID=A0ABU1AEM7_9BACT|nr:SH3 domain-containing protein [Coraliomargarita sp. SDUM461004]MDQ8193216.1 hypothetical protein [Coraliomargarita sp. SDUM461004]
MNLLRKSASDAAYSASPRRINLFLKIPKFILLYLSALAAPWLTLHADNFEDGVKAYHQSDYQEAASAFERSLSQMESAAAHHNLALSLYQQQRPAEAIWQLERAVRLSPANKNYLFKLGALRQQLGLYQQTTTWWQIASNSLSQRSWIYIASVCFWIIIAAILLPYMAGRKPRILLKLCISFAAIALALSSAALVIQSTRLVSGVIISNSPVSLHHAPASAAPEAGIARPGERAQILDQHNQFLKIQTEADITGWIHSKSLRQL